METKFNFKSQVSTSRSQSERLLALGLKKDTADMTHHYMYSTDGYELKDIEFSRIMHLQELVNKKPVLGRSGDDLYAKDIPAWSLHRLLLLLLDNRCVAYDHISFSIDETDVFTKVINHIEWLIKEGYFNKEYLEE